VNPDVEFFAWGSDHDLWNPRWLEALVAELDAHPEAVAAYPEIGVILEGGTFQFRDVPGFDTADVDDPRERAELIWEAGGFGSRVYGLFRTHALSRCGVFRYVYMPDRLLLVEMALQGRFREAPEVLWWRRRRGGGRPSFVRQRAAFFPDRRAPLRFRLPWFYVHGAALFSSLTLRGRGRPEVTRRAGAAFAARYLKLGRTLRKTQRAAVRAAAENESMPAESLAASATSDRGGRSPATSG
jgi:hypothetical protein